METILRDESQAQLPQDKSRDREPDTDKMDEVKVVEEVEQLLINQQQNEINELASGGTAAVHN